MTSSAELDGTLPAETSESVALEAISLKSEMNDEVETPRAWQLVRELDLFQVKCDREAVEAQWMQAVVVVELYERLLSRSFIRWEST